VQGQVAGNSLQNAVLSHFGMQENPFGVTPDPRFLFFSPTHREAVASLVNGIEWGFGFQVLVAQPGMGKTTLLLDLLRRFQGNAQTAFLFQPQLSPVELLQSLLAELAVTSQATSVRQLAEDLNRFLLDSARTGKRVIIILDEAQNLDFASLEMLRQLSNLETTRSKLMNVVLAGQPQLLKSLSAPEQQQLQQRISAIGRLSPFSAEDTALYITHRLQTARYRGTELFPPAVLSEVWRSSKGIPRNINRICFSAMLLAYSARVRSVSVAMMREAVRDLDPDYVFSQVSTLPEPREVSEIIPEARVPVAPVVALPSKIDLPSNATVVSQTVTVPCEQSRPASSVPTPVIAAEPDNLPAIALATHDLQPSTARKETLSLEVVAARKEPASVAASEVSPVRKPPKSNLTVAEVRLNSVPVPAQPAARSKASPAKQQAPHRHYGVWVNLCLTAVVAGLVLWFGIEKAASNSWHLPEGIGLGRLARSPVKTDPPVQKAAESETAPIATVYFEEDSATLDSNSRDSLQEVANMLGATPNLYLVIEGHTDNSGPEAYNLNLSSRRAVSVRDLLTNELHVSSKQLRIDAVGSAQPAQPNSSAKGRAYNRRVEIRAVESPL